MGSQLFTNLQICLRVIAASLCQTCLERGCFPPGDVHNCLAMESGRPDVEGVAHSKNANRFSVVTEQQQIFSFSF